MFKTIPHWGHSNYCFYSTYICVSLWQSLCIINHTFGRLPNWSLFQDTPCYVSWWKFYYYIFCHTTCTLFINAYYQCAYIKITIFSKRFVARITFLCSISLYITLHSVELQEPCILSLNKFFQFNALFSFLLIVCRLLDFLEHFVIFFNIFLELHVLSLFYFTS